MLTVVLAVPALTAVLVRFLYWQVFLRALAKARQDLESGAYDAAQTDQRLRWCDPFGIYTPSSVFALLRLSRTY